jgi:hypothetical protein
VANAARSTPGSNAGLLTRNPDAQDRTVWG